VKPARRARARARLAVCGAAVGGSLTAWGLLGDLTFRPDPDRQLDYMFYVGHDPIWLRVTAGALGAVLVVITALVLRLDHVVKLWWGAWALAALAGGLFGLIARVTTGGVVGANIGGGLALLGIPLGIGLLAIAASLAAGAAAQGAQDQPATLPGWYLTDEPGDQLAYWDGLQWTGDVATRSERG
jgi:hypothetical protein